MTTDANSPAPEKKRRNPVERIVVWTLILALLGLVLWEWRSRDSYNASVEAVQTAYAEKEKAEQDVLLSELEPHLRGFHTKSETPGASPTTVVIRWPSLFKTYEIRFTLDEASVVTRLETGAPPAE